MSEESDQKPHYKIVVLCGHPGSGKTALAHAVAQSYDPPGMMISIHQYVKGQFADIIDTDPRNLDHPWCNNSAYHDADDVNHSTSFGQAYDDYYEQVRVALPWHVWIIKLQSTILKELQKPDGQRIFVVDDIWYADECEFLMNFMNCNGVVIFLDGNPGRKFPVDDNRTSYTRRENIREDYCKKKENYFFTIDTKRNKQEPVIDSVSRCVKKIKVCLNVAHEQRRVALEKARLEKEEKLKKAAETAAAPANQEN